MGYIAGILIVGILTYGFYSLCELFVRRKERMAIIEKITNGGSLPQIDLKHIPGLGSLTGNYTALSIGCLFVGVGVGLFLAFLIEVTCYDAVAIRNLNERREAFNIIYPTLALLFGGVGLIVSYVIEKKSLNNSKK